MNEAQKTYASLSEMERSLFTGEGIDIGCGSKPVVDNALGFDKNSGDANYIMEYLPKEKKFDFVFSSHCLEHMHNPISCLRDWWGLVKPNGSLILVVPDEDLYEQGYYPSLFNDDHKHTFTIGKQRSWSPVSINLLEQIQRLSDKDWFTIEIMDQGYDHRKRSFRPRSNVWSRRALKWRNRLSKHGSKLSLYLDRFFCFLSVPIDQTREGALAQIKVVVKKL